MVKSSTSGMVTPESSSCVSTPPSRMKRRAIEVRSLSICNVSIKHFHSKSVLKPKKGLSLLDTKINQPKSPLYK